MTVSIIIAVKTWQKNLEECVAKCLELDFSDYEIIVLPDFNQEGISVIADVTKGKKSIPVEVIPTGPINPAKKRDLALNYARGEILAFIDDDAFPRSDWLKNALVHFNDPQVAAVGGPAITPEKDSLRQMASGAVFASYLVSGSFVYRYIPKTKREVQDYPSCNFLVRKSVMQELGGFNTNFWPGEDTKLCLDITQKMGKKIVYDPQVLVWHHRRPLFLPHLKQVANYALHRGYFVKKYPDTSLKLAYFIPSFFLLSLLAGGIFALLMGWFRTIYFFWLFSYLSLVLIFSIINKLCLIPSVFFGIILSHLTYGFWFLKGLLAKRLPEE